MKRYLLFISLLNFLSFNSFGQEKKKIDTLHIQTSGRCEMCEKRIEVALLKLPGVQLAEFNRSNGTVFVRYKTAKLTPQQLKQRITQTGYDADEMKADSAAYQQLPDCCKKERELH